MATAPTVAGRTVAISGQQTPFQNTNGATIDAFGGDSAGLIRGGKDLQQAGGQLMQVALAEQIDANEREVKKLDIALQEKFHKLQFGDEQNPGYLSTKGEQTVTGYKSAVETVDTVVKETLAGASNPRVQQHFSELAARKALSVKEGITRYHTQQKEVYDDTLSEARIQSRINSAAAAPQDEQIASEALAVIRGEEMSFARRKGLSPEAMQQNVDKRVSDMTAARVSALVDRDPAAAQAIFDANISKIQGTARADLFRKLEASNLAVQSQAVVEDISARAKREGWSEEKTLQHARDTLSGKLEDEAVKRIKELQQERWAAFSRAQAAEDRAYTQGERERTRQEREVKLQAPEEARKLMEAAGGDIAKASAAASKEFTGKMLEEVEAGIRRKYSDDEAARRQAERKADEQAWAYAERGERPPRSLMAHMDGTKSSAIDRYAEQRRMKVPISTDYTKYDEYMSMQADAIIAIDPGVARSQLNDADFAKFSARRDAAMTGRLDPKSPGSNDALIQATLNGHKLYQKADKDEVGRLRSSILEELDDLEKSKAPRKASQKERQEAIDRVVDKYSLRKTNWIGMETTGREVERDRLSVGEAARLAKFPAPTNTEINDILKTKVTPEEAKVIRKDLQDKYDIRNAGQVMVQTVYYWTQRIRREEQERKNRAAGGNQ